MSNQVQSDNQVDQIEEPRHVWMFSVVLKLLVFLAFAFVIFEALVGFSLGERDLGTNRLWAVIAGMVGLVLLLTIDRLRELRVSPTGGFEATLTEAKASALEEIEGLDHPVAKEAAAAQILQAKNTEQVDAVREMAIKLNVDRVKDRVKEAIRQKRKIFIRYRPEGETGEQIYSAAPLDITPGSSQTTKTHDYLLVHSDEHDSTLRLRMDRVLGVELSEETFDPAEAIKGWKDKAPKWNLPRDW